MGETEIRREQFFKRQRELFVERILAMLPTTTAMRY
jgi:hypothetical protein